MPATHLILLLVMQAAAAQAARPIEPGSWVRVEDYPVSAARAGTQGTVGFRLGVDPHGKVTACEILQSAGPDLDAVTCNILTARARFEPARDAAGAAIASTYRSRIKWSIPQDPAVPFAPAQRIVETWRPEGGHESCRVTNQGQLPRSIALQSCAPGAAAADQPPRSRHSTLRSWTILLPEGQTPPFAINVKGNVFYRVRYRFEVDAAGIVNLCASMDSAREREKGSFTTDDCELLKAYGKPIFLPAEPGGAPRRGVYERILALESGR